MAWQAGHHACASQWCFRLITSLHEHVHLNAYINTTSHSIKDAAEIGRIPAVMTSQILAAEKCCPAGV